LASTRPAHRRGRTHGGDLCQPAAQVVAGQQRPLDVEVVQPGEQVVGLTGHRDVAVPARRDRLAVADQLESQAAPARTRGRTSRHSNGLVGMPWISTTGKPPPSSLQRIGTPRIVAACSCTPPPLGMSTHIDPPGAGS
jgi:hypothetical protein